MAKVSMVSPTKEEIKRAEERGGDWSRRQWKTGEERLILHVTFSGTGGSKKKPS